MKAPDSALQATAHAAMCASQAPQTASERQRELSQLASEVIKDTLSLIHLPNHPESYVEDRLKRRAALALALLSNSSIEDDASFREYAEEMLTMTLFSEIMELQA